MTTNATEIVQNLKPDAIRQRLAEIDDEAKALRLLLRAAMRAQQSTKREVPREE